MKDAVPEIKKRKYWQFYCPSCRAERRIRLNPKPEAWVHVIQLGSATAFSVLATWPWFGWRGLVAFVPLWAMFEIYYRLKVRTQMPCSHCGFDPYLYLTDVNRARTEIDRHWRRVFEEKGIPFPGDEEEVSDENSSSLDGATPHMGSPPSGLESSRSETRI